MVVQEGTTLQHCDELSPRLRQHDLEELLASRPGLAPEVILKECVQVSAKTFSVISEEVGCVAIFGVRTSGDQGIPWMLSSEYLFEKAPRRFIRECRYYVEELTKDYSHSFNWVSVSNLKAQAWLEWLGFTVNRGNPITHNGVTFYPFSKVRIKDV